MSPGGQEARVGVAARPPGEAARVEHAVNFAAEPVAAPPARAFCPPNWFDCCRHHPLLRSDGTARETAITCWQTEQNNAYPSKNKNNAPNT